MVATHSWTALPLAVLPPARSTHLPLYLNWIPGNERSSTGEAVEETAATARRRSDVRATIVMVLMGLCGREREEVVQSRRRREKMRSRERPTIPSFIDVGHHILGTLSIKYRPSREQGLQHRISNSSPPKRPNPRCQLPGDGCASSLLKPRDRYGRVRCALWGADAGRQRLG